jgi:hypothetical protein
MIPDKMEPSGDSPAGINARHSPARAAPVRALFRRSVLQQSLLARSLLSAAPGLAPELVDELVKLPLSIDDRGRRSTVPTCRQSSTTLRAPGTQNSGRVKEAGVF